MSSCCGGLWQLCPQLTLRQWRHRFPGRQYDKPANSEHAALRAIDQLFLPRPQMPGTQPVNHIGCHGGEIVAWRPAPLVARGLVVERTRPKLSDRLGSPGAGPISSLAPRPIRV